MSHIGNNTGNNTGNNKVGCDANDNAKAETPLTAAAAKKLPYCKPAFTTEELLTFGALCNGSAIGGRKATSGPPSFCSPTKLKS